MLIYLVLVTLISRAIGQDNPCRPEGFETLPNPDDCSSYILCMNGAPFIVQCAEGMIFDVISNSCNREADSVCVKDIPTPPAPDTTTAATTTTPTTVSTTAPPGGSTTASTSTTTSIPTTTTTITAPTTVPTAPTESTIVPTAPTASTAVPTAPTGGTSSVATTSVTPTTTTPAIVTTPTTVQTTAPTIAPTTERPPGAPECLVTDVFFAPHPNCNLYFQCHFGHLYVLSCPPNQHWNQQRQYCDHPFNVQCTTEV
ncbi:uncharacterized protein LOC129727273 [Wyeomyia smithii]|uniref:uncharacterized protein LOC129727273 n=1 Tax=Wyeomyia smithii TaxID=174621 RepID=UPI002467CBC7|nr:uncharacterized protein LOC129727273 [Wyeomyia smithii]